MKTRKVKLRLKKSVIRGLKWLGVIFIVLLGGYLFYCKQINQFTELGYSKAASKKILFGGFKEYVLTVKENQTLNAAFESDAFNEANLKNYSKIVYVEHDNLIDNINKLLKKGYSNNDISIILSHGNDSEITEFAKRERIKYLEEFYEFPFAKLSYYDRYIAYSDSTGEDEKTTVIHVNLNMDKKEYDDAFVQKKFSSTMLVNKFHALDDSFEPTSLVAVPEEHSDGEKYYANKEAVNALIQMFESAKVDGLEMVVSSAYRSYDDQVELMEFYRKWYGDNYVNSYVARPGFSEHQTGLAFDVASTSTKVFVDSKEYEWMSENAYKYGFILRFYKKAETITGYKSEPWHYRYVGKEIAKYIYDHNITFEEYYVMFLDK